MARRVHAYRVHIGFTRTGKDRWMRFATLDEAKAFCEQVFAKCNTILTVERA